MDNNYPLPDIHFGEVGTLPEVVDDEEDDDLKEDKPASKDLIEILGFDPDKEDE